ncbi:MAG TPA: M23 family metallopeptidase [Candidatus Paceibacterota bacterium]|nr:M23 family metallopeptidase [Candidatus Paceibacterota bacterium]
MRRVLVSVLVFLAPVALHAATVSVYPSAPIQGDPVMISVEGTTSVSAIAFQGKPLSVFLFKGVPTAFYGFDINKKAGVYSIIATLADGSIVTQKIYVAPREKPQLAFEIPAKLGGNATSSQKTLVSTLAAENASLIGLRTGTHAFWTAPFGYPVSKPIITDTYGYLRDTGAVSVTHKGTDFHAVLGTPVMAVNRGVVRRVQETRDYGKTIIVDHGLGLMSFYMHLSKIWVNEGELVQKGQIIGLSGDTGYALSPHLHLTIRLNDISIDPAVFLGFFAR